MHRRQLALQMLYTVQMGKHVLTYHTWTYSDDMVLDLKCKRSTMLKCLKHYHGKICTHKRYIQLLVIAITLCKAYECFVFIHICQCKHTHKTQNKNTAQLKWMPNTVPVVTSTSLPCTSCCTYEVSWHLVVLSHPADLTQLQQGVNVVRIQVQDILQRSSICTPSC